MKFASRLLVIALYAFLLAPLAVIFLTSFSNDNFLAFPPQQWGLNAYVALLGNQTFIDGFKTSVVLASAVTLVSLVMGTAVAYAIARYSFTGRGLLLGLVTAPLLLPTIIVGLA